MKSRLIVCIGILMLIPVAWSQAQQRPIPMPSAIGSPATSASAYNPLSQASVPQRTTLPRQADAYQPQSTSRETASDDPGVPHYPYPPYPNPFYEEFPRSKPLADGMDWLWGLPSNVVGRFSTFIDTTLFPNKPATYGGGAPACPPVSPGPPAAPQPFVPQAPVPTGLPGTR
jgi:hypothetical protein